MTSSRTGVSDSIRNVFGRRVRLVKSFAGIMNPSRLVVSTCFSFLRGEKQGGERLSVDVAR